ncbi:MAG: hypothetical protein EA374_00855 [Acholeplasmatales bacterium]|nr:MAG: hypothetical protein EA374_00855 [Acholeplasmatales bacterium]
MKILAIGRFLLYFCSVLLLLSCSTDEPDIPNNEDPPENPLPILNHWDEITTAEETGLWLIYYYHPGCPACQHIEADIRAFHEEMGAQVPLYVAQSNLVAGALPDAQIKYVPTVLVIEGNTYQTFHTGVTDILALFDALRHTE